MSAAGARFVRNGELALIAGAARLSRMDWETGDHADQLEQCLRLVRDLPDAPLLLPGGLFSQLRYALTDYRDELARVRVSPAGERDWIEIGHAQGYLRQQLDRCHAALFVRCYAIWLRVGPERVAPVGGDR
jgi:hypothetical protein